MVYVDNYDIASDLQGTLFVSCDANEDVWRSSDQGNHWEPDYAGLPVQEEFGLCTNDSGLLMYSGGIGFFRSTDEGNTWIPMGGPKTVSTPTTGTAVFTTGAGGLIIAGVDDGYSDGIYRSTNYGKTYTPNYGQTWVRVDSELSNIEAMALDEQLGKHLRVPRLAFIGRLTPEKRGNLLPILVLLILCCCLLLFGKINFLSVRPVAFSFQTIRELCGNHRASTACKFFQ